MRITLSAFAVLGLLVAVLGAMERGAQISTWSSLIAWAAETGALHNEEFSKRLAALPRSPFSSVIAAVGIMITLVALWRLSVETRPRK